MAHDEQDNESLKIDLEPEEALRGLLAVDPEAPPSKPNAETPQTPKGPAKDQGDALDG